MTLHFFLKRFVFFLIMCICVHLCEYMPHRYRCLRREEVSGPLKLESQVVVRHRTWVLGTELRSSGSHRATSPAP